MRVCGHLTERERGLARKKNEGFRGSRLSKQRSFFVRVMEVPRPNLRPRSSRAFFLLFCGGVGLFGRIERIFVRSSVVPMLTGGGAYIGGLNFFQGNLP